jgi:hypothetical protein
LSLSNDDDNNRRNKIKTDKEYNTVLHATADITQPQIKCTNHSNASEASEKI